MRQKTSTPHLTSRVILTEVTHSNESPGNIMQEDSVEGLTSCASQARIWVYGDSALPSREEAMHGKPKQGLTQART